MNIPKDIYSLHVSLSDNAPRPHLGASLIGHDCLRYLWYVFRWAYKVEHDGQRLRLFETGNLEEARLIKELRLAGYEVLDREDGHQLRFKDHNGHFCGSVDGKIQINNEWFLLEIKTHGQKSFDYLKKNGVKKAKPMHVAQMQIYMKQLILDKALYVATCKNTDEIYTEIIKFEEKKAVNLRHKALKVIESDDTPERISNVIKGCFECEWCDFQKACHRLDASQLPEFNCRTCIHSTPYQNGAWACVKNRKEIEGQKGCDQHLFIPSLVPGELVGQVNESSLTYRTIDGKTIINEIGKGLMICE